MEEIKKLFEKYESDIAEAKTDAQKKVIQNTFDKNLADTEKAIEQERKLLFLKEQKDFEKLVKAQQKEATDIDKAVKDKFDKRLKENLNKQEYDKL